MGGFEVDRYLGKWYEIARLDHSFERNLILSRDKMLDQKIVAELVASVKQLDFDTEKLIYVEDNKKGGSQ